MIKTERRQSPRMKVEGLAYVTLDPENGGTVSDISEGGLSFYSTTPVRRTTTIRFWFSQRNYKVEGDGRMACTRFLEAQSELAWTDETGRRGGLRFTSLGESGPGRNPSLDQPACAVICRKGARPVSSLIAGISVRGSFARGRERKADRLTSAQRGSSATKRLAADLRVRQRRGHRCPRLRNRCDSGFGAQLQQRDWRLSDPAGRTSGRKTETRSIVTNG